MVQEMAREQKWTSARGETNRTVEIQRWSPISNASSRVAAHNMNYRNDDKQPICMNKPLLSRYPVSNKEKTRGSGNGIGFVEH